MATGVVYHHKGRKVEVKASKEVILSAGSYGSPKILQLSGLGNGDDLAKHQIPVVKHMPGVGENLKDHYVNFAIFNSTFEKSLDSAENLPGVFINLANYLLRKKGPFASNIGEAGGFVKSPGEDVVNVQFHFAPNYFVQHGLKNPEKGNGYSVASKLLIPKSSGSVKLASGNYKSAPLIDHNYLSDDDDLKKSMWALKQGFKIGNSKSFKPFRQGWFSPSKLLTDDAALEDFVRQTGETLYHPTSTCRMGNDDTAVVNDKLCVHGIKGLRVADASIMPTIVRGNTNAPSIMIGEKAADLLLNDKSNWVEKERESILNKA